MRRLPSPTKRISCACLPKNLSSSTSLLDSGKKLEPAIHEHLDFLLAKELSSTKIEQRYDECTLNLREEYFRSLARKIEVVLALEAQSGGKAAELAKLKEHGMEVNIQLGEVFAQKSRRRLEQRK